MEIIKLTATRRTECGKGPSNRLRREGRIPAICYGRDLAATPVAVSPKSLLQVLGSEHGRNSVLELELEGGERLTVMVRDYSYHPITRELVHADFVQVKLDQPVEVDVPFRCVGKSKGVAAGGVLQQIFRRVPIRCLPEHIPAVIEADITELDVGASIKASALRVPEGAKVLLPDDQTVVVVNAPERAAEEGAGAAQAAAGQAAAAAAPAAKAAPAKGKEEKKK